MRYTGRSTHPEQYSGEVAMHLARGNQPIRSGVFPGKADLADEWAGQPQLPAGGGDQPTPTVGCLGVAGTDRGPAKGLFEEAEGMLDGEPSQVPAPQHTQVSWQWAADPGQPQGPRWQLLVGQALDLDAHHAERSIRRASHVELSPGVDPDFAIGWVAQSSRMLRLAMRAVIGQPKGLTVQARPAAAWMPFGAR
jgi:hypothetical protein